MAIYSLHHSSIGKSTQKAPFTAAAHVGYVTRPSACARAVGTRLPEQPEQLRAWFNAAESRDRKNARVCDKVMLALPRELDAEQRYELVRAFAEDMTNGEAPWFAAFHDLGKDAANPHCHLIIRDRHPETGKRVIGMSESGSTERLREAWERECNQALELARQPARVSRLTLEAQGIQREPTIHEGVRARQMAREDKPMRSQRRNQMNAAKARSRSRVVDYPAIDSGTPRRIHNSQVRLRAMERSLWAALDQDRLEREIRAQKWVHRPDLLGRPGRDTQESSHDIVDAAAERGRGGRAAASHPGTDGADPEPSARGKDGHAPDRNLPAGGPEARTGRPRPDPQDSPAPARKPTPESGAPRVRRAISPDTSQLTRKEPAMGMNPYFKDYRIAQRMLEELEFEYRQVESRIHHLEVGAQTYGFMPEDIKRQLDTLKPKERVMKPKLIEVRSRAAGLRDAFNEWERHNRDPDKVQEIPHGPDDPDL